MQMRQDKPILLAEIMPDSAISLAGLLRLLGYRVCPAQDSDSALLVLRREVVHSAIVAVELTYRGRPLLARVAALPSMRNLLAVGPAGQARWELRARRAGAGQYFPRPVDPQRLTQTLGGFSVRDRLARSP